MSAIKTKYSHGESANSALPMMKKKMLLNPTTELNEEQKKKVFI